MQLKAEKPLADLGSGRSTLSAEAHLLGLEMIPVDLMERARGDGKEGYIRAVESQLSFLIEYGTQFETSRLSESHSAAEAAFERLIIADIAEMPFTERHFSVAIAHDSVPKHSHSADVFLDQVLPEMLRVTDSHLYVYPFACFKTGDEGELEVTQALYQDEEILTRTEDIARKAGFSFELLPITEHAGPPIPAALFRRFHNEDLASGTI